MTAEIAATFTPADRSYACAILHTGSAEVVGAVESDQIGDPVAREIHRTAVELLARGVPIDCATVTQAGLATRPSPWVADVLGIYLDAATIPANWKTYVATVHEGHHRRRAAQIAAQINDAAHRKPLNQLRAHLTAAGSLVAR
jgi:replicative DNA helicase